MAQNLDIWDWRLSDEEMARIATLDEDESLFNYGTAAGARARRAFKATTRQPSQPFGPSILRPERIHVNTMSLTRSPERPAMATGGRPRSAASKPARRASMIPCAAASLAMFLIGMDTFIVNVALPTIGTELHTNMAAQQWIVDGFTLAFAALLLLAGNLSDRFGAKRAFMADTAGFAVSSLICALAVGAGMLVLGRALLGVSAALFNISTVLAYSIQKDY